VKDVEEGEEAEETEESLAAGRFVEMFLRHLLKGIDAKEKFVRLRVCQLIALAMNSMGEIEYVPPSRLGFLVNGSDDLFDDLRDRLGKRTRDRESSVRVQAVIALARFQSSDDEAGIRVTKALIELLQHDPSAYVSLKVVC
jgi:condensin complex subunit 3